jgi:hypothetical protein
MMIIIKTTAAGRSRARFPRFPFGRPWAIPLLWARWGSRTSEHDRSSRIEIAGNLARSFFDIRRVTAAKDKSPGGNTAQSPTVIAAKTA